MIVFCVAAEEYVFRVANPSPRSRPVLQDRLAGREAFVSFHCLGGALTHKRILAGLDTGGHPRMGGQIRPWTLPYDRARAYRSRHDRHTLEDHAEPPAVLPCRHALPLPGDVRAHGGDQDALVTGATSCTSPRTA